VDLDVKLITRQIQARESRYWHLDISLSHKLPAPEKERRKKETRKKKKKRKIK